MINLYILGAFALCTAVASGWAGCERKARQEAAEERDQFRAERDAAISDNETNQVTIAAQREALQQWSALGVSPEVVATVMKTQREVIEKFAEKDRVEIRTEERERAEKPDCDALLRTDFAATCPAHARILRDYENNHTKRAP